MNNKTSPKDFFLHLGAVIALYASAVALIELAFECINKALPDALSYAAVAPAIVWPVSMLIVLVPVLYVIEWLIGRDIARMPEKRGIWARRWRIYLTLFLTGAAIVGDLIALISTYLNGEVTGRFIAKILVVLVVAGVIFAYHIIDRASDSRSNKKELAKLSLWRRILAWIGIIIALSGIAFGFVIVGSPAHQRALRFDEARASDLMNIQWQVVSYWQAKGHLPAMLSDLDDSIDGFSAPTDPETGAAYGYTATASTTFSLCASFDEASAAPMPEAALGSGSSQDSWAHPAGQACFPRSIDPSRYPPTAASAATQE